MKMNIERATDVTRGIGIGMAASMIVIETLGYSSSIAGKIAFAGIIIMILSPLLIWAYKERDSN